MQTKKGRSKENRKEERKVRRDGRSEEAEELGHNAG